MTYTPLYTTAANVYAKTGLSDCEIDLSTDANLDNIIADAENELELLVGRKFTDANENNEWLSIKDKDIIGDYQTTIVLGKFPIQSITTFRTVGIDGAALDTFDALTAGQISAETYATDDYWLETSTDSVTRTVVPSGKITLKAKTFPVGTNVVQVIYTYGYSTVPTVVRDLATCLAGMRAWIAFMGGQYNRFNSYSIPQQDVDKGDFYRRAKQNIALLELEANRLLDRIGRKLRTAFFSTGGAR